MATFKKMAPGKIKKVKPPAGAQFIKDYVFDPTNKMDYVSAAIGGPVFRMVGGITKKGAKFVAKTYKNMGR